MNKIYNTEYFRKLKVCFMSMLALMQVFSVNAINVPTVKDWLPVMPRTPEVASFERYGDYPIGYNNGTVGINVPLFNFALYGGFSLPVGLSYHSSGIKITDVSGRVGTGWTLNAGGCISRDQRGLPDDKSVSGFYRFVKSHPNYAFPKNVNVYDHAAILDSISNGSVDSEPDIFYVTIPGRTIKMFFGNDGAFHTIPQTDIKVSKTALDASGALGGWTIVDESGIRYHFGEYGGNRAIEMSENTNTGTRTATAWKLLAVESPYGNVLATFRYSRSNYKNPVLSHRVYRFYDSSVYQGSMYLANNIGEITGESTYSPSFDFEGMDLSEISMPGIGAVSFHTSLANNNYIHKIDEIKYTSAVNGKSIAYSLVYDTSQRCFLTSIERSGSSGTSEPFRKFEYYPGLPDGYDSHSQDFWGYYNGKSNSSLYPVSSYFVHRQLDHNDRYPTANAVCGSLRTITYPTGGSTMFEYENNDVYAEHNTMYNIVSRGVSFTADDASYIGSSFNMGVMESMMFRIEFALHPAGLFTTRFMLKDSSGKTIFDQTDNQLAYNSTRLGKTSESYELFEYKNDVVLSPGVYHWEVRYGMNGPKDYAIHPAVISMNYYEAVKSDVSGSKMVGGIRIRRIRNYDSVGGLSEERTYSYTDASGRSSGQEGPQPFFVKHSIARYSSVGSDMGGAGIVTPIYAGIEEVGEENLCRYSGSAVQYSLVTETRTTGENTYLTEYRYRQRRFTPASVTCNTFHNSDILLPYNEDDYLEGIATSQKAYRNNGGSYTPAAIESYGYDIAETSPFAFRQKSVALNVVAQDGNLPISDRYYFGTYELVSAKLLPTETKTVEYSSNGVDCIVSKSSQTYNINSAHVFPTGSSTCIGGSDCASTVYRYCFDDVSNPIMLRMIELNMLSTPVLSRRTYRGKTYTTTRKYGIFSVGGTTVVAPAEVSCSNGRDVIRVEYTSYDKYGNPQSATINGSEHRFYIWSYAGKYPIAEISGNGVTFSQVENAIVGLFGKSLASLSATESPDVSVLRGGRLQRMLSGLSVTTFTFDGTNGIATVTNPNGITTSYAYGDFGRLLSALSPSVNANGSIENAIQESYKYNYRK